MSHTTSTLPTIPAVQRGALAIVGALVAAAVALTILMASTRSTEEPAVGRSGVETFDRVGTADATERRANLADAYRGDSQRVGSADAAERWIGR